MGLSNRQIALEFLRRFSARQLDLAAQLMADDLHFTGPPEPYPFHTGDEGSRARPANVCRHTVINVIEDHVGGVTVLYEYEGDATLMVAQWFSFADQRIVKTDLVFEPKSSYQDWSALLVRGVRGGLRRSPSDVARVPVARSSIHSAIRNGLVIPAPGSEGLNGPSVMRGA